MIKRLVGAAALGLLAGSMTLAGTAWAQLDAPVLTHHNPATSVELDTEDSPSVVTATSGWCGAEFSFDEWTGSGDDALLVVYGIDDGVRTAGVGETIAVDWYSNDPTVQWRIFAGGTGGGSKRANDAPLWDGHPDGDNPNPDFKDDVKDYKDINDWDWATGGPNGGPSTDDDGFAISWYEFDMNGCPKLPELTTDGGGCVDTELSYAWPEHDAAIMSVYGIDGDKLLGEGEKGDDPLMLEVAEEDRELRYEVRGSGGKLHYTGYLTVDGCPADENEDEGTGGSGGDAGDLPETGINTGVFVLGGTLLIGTGAALYVVGRRRRNALKFADAE